MLKDDLQIVTDLELLSRIHHGGNDKSSKDAVSELISRYLRLVLKRARAYSDNYSDVEDLTQEGLLALYKAIDSFDAKRGAKFSAFADVCVTNRIRTVAAGNARATGNNLPISDENDIEVPNSSPESICLDREYALDVKNKLSPLERKVFKLYLDSQPYSAIAEKLGIPEKSVDNAVFRLRKKLKILLADR